MAIKLKNSFIKEDIVDENGNKLGELKFNPNDSRIMKTLTEIVNYSTKAMNEVDKIKVKDISEIELNTAEDFEKTAVFFEQMDKAYDIEVSVVDKVIDGLSEIFGKETVNLFTNGTKDAECLLPIIEFVAPYVENARKSKVNAYLPNSKHSTNTDVME